jgi:hypothetical protein
MGRFPMSITAPEIAKRGRNSLPGGAASHCRSQTCLTAQLGLKYVVLGCNESETSSRAKSHLSDIVKNPTIRLILAVCADRKEGLEAGFRVSNEPYIGAPLQALLVPP